MSEKRNKSDLFLVCVVQFRTERRLKLNRGVRVVMAELEREGERGVGGRYMRVMESECNKGGGCSLVGSHCC